MNVDPNQAKAVFLEAVEKHDPDQWPAFLDQACAGQPELRHRVEMLLASHGEAGTVLRQAPDSSPAPLEGGGSGEHGGNMIGPYKLLQQIGEGGMGTVWMAEQTQPVQRKVALKIIKAGMDSRQVLARFEAERQALALMDHPHIAKVLDGGSTDAGRPYFVMELVKGQPITKYCDEHRMTPHQRLELFVPVCQAIQHAHQKGLIHRDIKPSNILVAPYDGRPVVKVIDFGVAKATGQRLTERTLFTEFGAVVGTLEYMSPEQTELNNQDIDTRSDIYSLGVLLYELLTGTTPLSRQRLKQAAFTEMLRMIREEEPPKPSTRLSESRDALPAISAQRHTEPAKLTKLVRGDLDWIVMKALDKDRSRRYETANGLAMDLQRYLADEPVVACPPTAWYRFRKFARRNKVGLATALVVLAALVLGIIGTTWQAIRATDAEQQALTEQETAQRERDQADEARKEAEHARDREKRLRKREKKLRQETQRQKQRAEDNFAKARRAVDAYFTAVSESQLLKVPGMQELRRQLLQSALAFYQQFLKERGADPSIRAGVASAQLRVGKILKELGQGRSAYQALQAARTGYEAALHDSPADLDLKAELAETWFLLASLVNAPAQALRPHEKAIDLRQELLRARPKNARSKKDLAESLNAYGIRLVRLKRHDEALQAYRHCVALRLELAREYPNDPAIHQSLFQSFNNIAVELANRRHRQQALEMYLQANQYGLAAYARMPHAIDFGTGLGIGYSNAAWAYWRLGQKEAALREFQKAADHLKVFSQNNPAVPTVQSHFVQALRDLAMMQRTLGRTEDAARSLRLARGVVERFPRETPGDFYYLACFRAIYAGLIGHAKARLSDEEASERREQADQAMAALKQAVAKGYANVEFMKNDKDLAALRGRRDFKALIVRLEDEARVRALAKGIKGTPDQRLHLNEEVLAILQKLAAGDPQNKRYRANLATSQHAIGLLEMELGKLDDAARALGQALALRDGLVKEDAEKARYRADLAATRLALGNLHWKAGRHAAAVRWWDKGLALFDSVPRDPAEKTAFLAQAAQSERDVAASYAQVGLYEESARHLARSFEQQPPTEAMAWRAHACFRLLADDNKGYRSACAGIIKRFDKSTIPHDLHCVTTACTLASKPFGDPARWIKRAKEFAKVDPKKSWTTIYVGLAYHRAGRFEEALKHLKPQGNWALSWPLLAMTYHRLGKVEQARQWLKKADDWYEETMRAALSGDLQLSLGGLYLWDRPQFLVLHRQAKALIEDAEQPDPWLPLWQGRVYARLGYREQAQAQFRAAVAVRPRDTAIWLAHARVFAHLGEHEQAEADFTKAINIKPADPLLWIARGRYFAERGLHQKADADFARAAALTPDELNKFIEAGWWVAGPYPYELKLPCPPEKDADPSRPVAAFSLLPTAAIGSPVAGLGALAGFAGAQFDWKPCPTDLYGTVRRGHPVLERPGGPVAAYALTYVYSPDKQPATLLVGGDFTRVWLNGRFVHEMKQIINNAFCLDRVPVMLKPGRNTLLVKANDNDGSFWFRVRLADYAMDRGLALGEVGLWKEAAEAFARRFEGQSLDWDFHWYCGALSRLQAGNVEAYQQLATTMLKRYGVASATMDVLRTCTLSSQGAPDTASLMKAAEKVHDANPKHNWNVYNLGMAHYRAGKFKAALRYIKQAQAIGDWAVFWPARAMAHHRLGQAARARQWLQKADQYHQQHLQESLGRTPFSFARPWLHWADWAYFEIFRREAKQLIEGKPPADDPALLAALRARAWAEMGKHARAKAEWDRAVRLKPKDPRVWIARGRHFAERGEHKKADADFARAASLTPNELNKFLEAGWWVVGPYPGGLKAPCPPEKDPDPWKPVAVPAPAGQAAGLPKPAGKALEKKAWLSVPTSPEIGLVHLAPLFNNAPDMSAYALTYVYSPEERSVLLRVGGHGSVRLWVNGRLAYEAAPAPGWEWALDPVPVTLHPGRNTLLVKVAGGGWNLGFFARVADAPIDRAWTYADLSLFKEASDLFARQFKHTLSDNYHLWSFHALLLLANGDTAGYHRVAADMLERWGNASDHGTCANVAATCCWGPAGTFQPARLLDLAKKGQLKTEPYRKLWLGVAHYRAGQFDDVIRTLKEMGDGDARCRAVLAMAHHKLKKPDEARQWLKKAKESYDFSVREALTGTTLKPVMGSCMYFVDFLLYYREAKTLIDGPGWKDANLEALQARGREVLKKRDPATAPYDYALMLQPEQARLWLARGRRLADLKRWHKADADLARAAELKPDYPQVLRERSRVATGLGKPAQATAFLARARALEVFVVVDGKGASEHVFTSLADAVAAAADGDTIEIRGNGPFVTLPVVIQGRALTIRAKAGTRPVIKVEGEGAKSHAPLLTTDAPLIVEALEFQRWDQKNWVQGQTGPMILRATGKSLYVANCRFRANLPDRNRPHRHDAISASTAICDVRNCQFLCPTEISVDTSSEKVTLDNCVHLGRLVLTLGNSAEYRLRHNTLVTESAQALHFFLPAGQLKPNQPARPTKVEASGNIISAGTVLYVDVPGGKPKPLELREAKMIFPRALVWTGRENSYQGLNYFVSWTGVAEIQPSPGPRDLDDWRKFWGSAETGSKTGSPRFKGGNLLARLADAPDKLTPDDFRLAKGSAGYRTGKDGKDLGANVDLVGPGPAYERWKKTPEYQQWLKETGQVKK
jgi:serine/threonine protein kinase/tetratricopeptide (TPR) repeat protein